MARESRPALLRSSHRSPPLIRFGTAIARPTVRGAGRSASPFDEILDLARRFCAAEPAAVLLSVEATEQKWTSEVSHGDGYLISLLNRYRAARALIRQWAGYDAALAQKDAQIQKLERVVWDAIYALQKAGLDQEAARLRRVLGRG